MRSHQSYQTFCVVQCGAKPSVHPTQKGSLGTTCYMLHIIYYILHTKYYILHIVHYTLIATHYTLHTKHCTLKYAPGTSNIAHLHKYSFTRSGWRMVEGLNTLHLMGGMGGAVWWGGGIKKGKSADIIITF